MVSLILTWLFSTNISGFPRPETIAPSGEPAGRGLPGGPNVGGEVHAGSGCDILCIFIIGKRNIFFNQSKLIHRKLLLISWVKWAMRNMPLAKIDERGKRNPFNNRILSSNSCNSRTSLLFEPKAHQPLQPFLPLCLFIPSNFATAPKR